MLALVSWGYVGYQTVARIAENHRSQHPKAAVQSLLGGESITDVASYFSVCLLITFHQQPGSH